MYFAVISIFPEMFATIREFGITGRAVTQKQVTIECINPRDFTVTIIAVLMNVRMVAVLAW